MKKLLNILCITFAIILSVPLFSGCTPKESPVEDFEYQEYGDGIAITEYIGDDKDVVIPSKIEGMPVTTIGRAFYNKEIESVYMPDSITYISVDAFFNCDNLTSIRFSKNLEVIDIQAFYSCNSIKELEFPSSIKEIRANAFEICVSLTSITIPHAETIGISAFGQNTSLTEINLGSIKEINASFVGCTSLTEITIPAGDIKLSTPFMGCSALTTIYFEGNAPKLEEGARTFIDIATPYNKEEQQRTPLDVTFYYKKGTTGWDEGYWLEISNIERFHLKEK